MPNNSPMGRRPRALLPFLDPNTSIEDMLTDQDTRSFSTWIDTAHHRDKILPTLGWCQLAIFLAILELKGEATGARIIKWLEARQRSGARKVNSGQIYGTLAALEADQFLVSTSAPPPTGRGRQVNIYTMQPLGLMALKLCLMWLRARPEERHHDVPSKTTAKASKTRRRARHVM